MDHNTRTTTWQKPTVESLRNYHQWQERTTANLQVRERVRGREGGREREREGEREGGRERERERGREGGREGERERESEYMYSICTVYAYSLIGKESAAFSKVFGWFRSTTCSG